MGYEPEPEPPRLAPRAMFCRCLENPLERGLRHNASRRGLRTWNAWAQKSKRVAGALKRMTPEGRMMGAGFRAIKEKLMEARRMKKALAMISPGGRAMCATPTDVCLPRCSHAA